MALFSKGNGGIRQVRDYYEQLKIDEWKGVSRNNEPYYGPGSGKRHASQMVKLGGLYMLRTFRTTEPKLYTVAKTAVSPVVRTNTHVGKALKWSLDVLKTAQTFGAPNGLTTHYPDIPQGLDDPIKRVTEVFTGGGKASALGIRKRYGLGYNTLTGVPGYETFGMYNEFQNTYGQEDNIWDDTPGHNFTFEDMIPVIIGDYQFRGLIAGLSDSISPTWNETSYIGRPDSMYSYGGFKRDISFDLTVAATRPSHLRFMWQKINNIANYVLPQQDAGAPGTRFNGRLLDLTIGNYIERELCIMTGFTITPSEDAPWEIHDPDLDYPSRTLHPGLGGSVMKGVGKYNKAKDVRKAKKAAEEKGEEFVPEEDTPIPEKRYVMPRIVTINLAFSVIHHRIPASDPAGNTLNRLFNHDGFTDNMSVNLGYGRTT